MLEGLGKSQGYAGLAYIAVGMSAGLCATGHMSGSEFVAALGVIMGIHHGGGVLVAKRDAQVAANGSQIEESESLSIDGRTGTSASQGG